jgi:pimeloyl-ACP methyl ester carboxylesterase
MGYSQGGHGALWANELADDWGPELDLVGSVAGAPVTEMPSTFGAEARVSGFFISMVAGFQAAYPDADPALLLTDAGLASLELVDQGCIGDVFAAVAALDEQLVHRGPTPPAWARLLEANDPGQVAVDSPVLILHSRTDELLPASLSERLLERLCSAGQVVERRTYDAGETHMAAAPAAFADGFDWIDGLMNDTATARSTCP